LYNYIGQFIINHKINLILYCLNAKNIIANELQSVEHCSRHTNVSTKVAAILAENGHKQDNQTIKQVLQHKQKGRETWDVRGKGGRTRFNLSVKEQRFDGDPNELPYV